MITFKKNIFCLLGILSILFISSVSAADKNGEIWYQRIGGEPVKINDGQTHNYPSQDVARTGDNLLMTCYDHCDNNVYTEFIGVVTVVANCEKKNHGDKVNIKLKLNGVSGKAGVTCDKEPPTCTTALDPEDWTCPSTNAFVDSCEDTISGCDLASFDPPQTKPRLLEINNTTLADGQACDKSGNCAICQKSPPAKIDCQPPTCPENVQLEHVGLGLPTENAGKYEYEANEFRADDGTLNILFSVEDGIPTTNVWGQSGIDWDQSILTIERVSGQQLAKSQRYPF